MLHYLFRLIFFSSKFHTLLNEIVNAKFHHLQANKEPSAEISIQV